MFALRQRPPKSRPQSGEVEGFECRDTDIDISSPIPHSLISTINSDDFSFSPSPHRSVPGQAYRNPPPTSTSNFLSPLRRAMKMSGILEAPPTDAPRSLNQRAYSVLDFTRREVQPVINAPKQASGLTQLLIPQAAPIPNPFSHLLRPRPRPASTGDSEPQSNITITVYFPHASAPSGDGLVLELLEEAKVEELVGLALWTYWDKGWLPQLSVNHTKDSSSHRSITSSWRVFPVNNGFVDYEHGAHDPSDKVRLLNGVVEFALLESNEDDYRRTQSGHRKSCSLPSSKMNLLLHARKKSYGSRHISTKSVLVRKDFDELELEVPISTEMRDIIRRVCKVLNLAHPEDYVLMARDVRGTSRAVPFSHRLSTFPDRVELQLERQGDPLASTLSRRSLPTSYVYIHS